MGLEFGAVVVVGCPKICHQNLISEKWLHHKKIKLTPS